MQKKKFKNKKREIIKIINMHQIPFDCYSQIVIFFSIFFLVIIKWLNLKVKAWIKME
jgi:hypothetical protein